MAAQTSPSGPDEPSPTPDSSTVDERGRVVNEAAESEISESDVEQSGIDWNALPDPVRLRLAEISASAVSALAKVDVPAAVRPVVKFAPAKRARLGASALIAGLRQSATFRSAVVQWCREHQAAALDLGARDAVAAAAAATLLGDASAVHYLELVSSRTADTRLRSERDAALAAADRMAAENGRLTERLDAAAGAADEIREERTAELERLRKRLREQGVRLREAKDDSAAAAALVERIRAESSQLAEELTAQRDRERERAEVERMKAERAQADADVARQAAREARQADEVRLALLVDTLSGAVTGLRRELALGGSGPHPADMIRGATTGQGAVGRVEDPAALDRLLALPAVHVIVDGYNVTKTGYPELTLSDQRDRLAHQMSALAARTGAEVTVVFDGAGVVAVPAAGPRGVRVLFSDPGVLADDVIRALVAAEPEGRPVVVVTSDRAVADSVRRRGAHPVPSAVLVARLGRV